MDLTVSQWHTVLFITTVAEIKSTFYVMLFQQMKTSVSCSQFFLFISLQKINTVEEHFHGSHFLQLTNLKLRTFLMHLL